MAIEPSTTLEIASRRFSREAEKEADEGAIRRLRHANLSSRGLSDFFARIERSTDVIPEWLSTHPASAAQRKALLDSDAALGPSAGELPRQDWQAIKEACSGRRDAEPSEENRLGAGDRSP
jgi:predicted Zn-dependent protease